MFQDNVKEKDKRLLHSNPAGISDGSLNKDLSALPIIKTMLGYIWPRDRPELKIRVVAALGLLAGAKVGHRCRFVLFTCILWRSSYIRTVTGSVTLGGRNTPFV